MIIMLVFSCFVSPAASPKTAEAAKQEESAENTEKKSGAEEKTEEDELAAENERTFRSPWLEELDSAEAKTGVAAFGGMAINSEQKKSLSDTISTLKKEKYELGFVMIDLKSGRGLLFNPDQPFYSASSVKGLYVAAMTYFYPESFEEEYDVITDVLVYSDNEEYEYLWYSYGSYCMECWAEMAGVTDVDWETLMYTDYSARDLAKLWLLNDEYFRSGAVENGLPKLYETPDISRFHEVLGEKYKTRSKAGWIPSWYDVPTYDEGGIIYAADAPYVLAFVSTIPEDQMEKADDLIRLLDIIHEADMQAVSEKAEEKPKPVAAWPLYDFSRDMVA